MSAPARRRPPKRHCPLCGGDVYAWQEDTPCRNCAAELRPDRASLVDEIRARRLERRSRVQTQDDTPAPLEYGELPEGF